MHYSFPDRLLENCQAGNLNQVMRGILFPNSNIIFTVQTNDPGEKKNTGVATEGGFNWTMWGSNLYSGWEIVDYAAIALAESAPMLLTPGRKCENGKPVPVNPEIIVPACLTVFHDDPLDDD